MAWTGPGISSGEACLQDVAAAGVPGAVALAEEYAPAGHLQVGERRCKGEGVLDLSRVRHEGAHEEVRHPDDVDLLNGRLRDPAHYLIPASTQLPRSTPT